ncbi:hypothetical protein [Herbaspirillum robiniae]|uniref:Uncharacterized protein n=1 Tax=Herbaspirillum robiniae TaxID=2014887 RepID=A0ABX2M0Q0_9BURK|nr:hypothetical protein [Herbaspirillum robiniae]NUU04249.1 hypothetical protein [Herbaspirillum robiniae]
MNTATMLVEHYMLLIKNIAYLSAIGVHYFDRMEPLVLRAVDHLYIAHVGDASTCKVLLCQAIENELCYSHCEPPEYTDSLRVALQSLGHQLH